MSSKDWNASLYDQKHAFVFEYGKSLLSLLDPQPGESILDLGCGTGHLTKAIAESGAHVVGLDSFGQIGVIPEGVKQRVEDDEARIYAGVQIGAVQVRRPAQ